MSKKFPRRILHARKMIGLGLIKPLTAIQIQAIKLYIRNRRARTIINSIIEMHDEMIFVEKGYNEEVYNLKVRKETLI